ncbi:MAG: hypothetical protein Aurels2KO_58150 [Aureliella sp.]
MVRLFKQTLTACLIVVASVLLIGMLPLLLLTYAAYSAVLYVVVWLAWCTRSRNVLLVYSNSPNWQDYVETELIPQLPENTIVLNWSERRSWPKLSLPVLVFRHFGGSREFNPIVLVFKPFHWTRTFRFWQAFRAYKHGKPDLLFETQDRLTQYMNRVGVRAS